MGRMICTALIVAAALTSGACAGRQAVCAWDDRPQDDCRVHAAGSAFMRSGPVSGYLQTPTGGAAGTTTPRRPTLEEIGVTHAVEYGARANVDYQRHRASFEFSNLLLHGDDTLTEDLVSQGRPFPAGTHVTSDSNLMTLTMGYSYLFEVRFGGRDRLELRPGLGLRAVPVHYRLEGSNGQRTSRHYTPPAPNLDLQMAWRPRGTGNMRFTGYLARTLEAHFTDPLRHMEVFEANARANWDFSSRGSIFVETGYKHILLQDDQPTMQNRILTDFGPWIGFGGELRF